MNCTRSFQVEPQNLGLRHWCEQGDNLDSYGWNQHDGKNFGIQKIRDRGVQVYIQFSNKCQLIYEQLKNSQKFKLVVKKKIDAITYIWLKRVFPDLKSK